MAAALGFGLGAAAIQSHAASLDSHQVKCGFRLVLKSYEIDAIAPTAEEARAWVRGVNHLPLGAKHRQPRHLQSQKQPTPRSVVEPHPSLQPCSWRTGVSW